MSDADRVAAVMECMGSEAHRTSAPILYENVFKSRFSQDALDKQMYDVLRRNVYSDPNRIFSSSFVWKDSAVSLFRRATHDGNSNWMSAMEGKKEYINGILASISVSITG